MSLKEIEQIFKIFEEKKEERKKNNQEIEKGWGKRMIMTTFFNRPIKLTQEEYKEFIEEIEKLKEKYLKIESEIKEDTKKRINEITFKEFLEYINELKSIKTIEGYFTVFSKNNKNIEFEDLIKLYSKIKAIILLKGESTCYTIISKEVLFFIGAFEYFIDIEKENIFETKELTDFIFKNVFLVGENGKYDYLEKCIKNKYSDLSLFQNFLFKNFNVLKKESMRKPFSPMEKIISDIMKNQNVEDKSSLILIKIKEINIDSLDEFEKDFFKMILIPDIIELNKEIIIEQKLKKDFSQSKDNLEIKPENRLFFYKGENLGKDEDLYTEYKDYYNLPNLQDDSPIIFTLKKTICSFLNTKGGRIYIGIYDDFEIKGYQIVNIDEKEKIKNKIMNLVSDFFPKVENELIKIHFIPVKDYFTNEYINNTYVIKIIVLQGNIHELYSIQKDTFQSFIRLPGLVRELITCDEVQEEIIKRITSEEKPVNPQEFDDIEPDDPNLNDDLSTLSRLIEERNKLVLTLLNMK